MRNLLQRLLALYMRVRVRKPASCVTSYGDIIVVDRAKISALFPATKDQELRRAIIAARQHGDAPAWMHSVN